MPGQSRAATAWCCLPRRAVSSQALGCARSCASPPAAPPIAAHQRRQVWAIVVVLPPLVQERPHLDLAPLAEVGGQGCRCCRICVALHPARSVAARWSVESTWGKVGGSGSLRAEPHRDCVILVKLGLLPRLPHLGCLLVPAGQSSKGRARVNGRRAAAAAAGGGAARHTPHLSSIFRRCNSNPWTSEWKGNWRLPLIPPPDQARPFRRSTGMHTHRAMF